MLAAGGLPKPPNVGLGAPEEGEPKSEGDCDAGAALVCACPAEPGAPVVPAGALNENLGALDSVVDGAGVDGAPKLCKGGLEAAGAEGLLG